MANGCGICEFHGAGCGTQAGVVGASSGLAGLAVIPGSGVKPIGLAIPLLRGAKEAPIGLANGSVESESITVACAFREVVRSGKLVGVVTETVPGLSNCWNWACSRSIFCCAESDTPCNAEAPGTFDQGESTLGAPRRLLSGAPLEDWPGAVADCRSAKPFSTVSEVSVLSPFV